MFFSHIFENIGGLPAWHTRVIVDRNPLTKNIKRREIQVPNGAMKKLHRNLLVLIRSHDPLMPNATGAIPGASPFWHVRIHRRERGQQFVFPRYLLHLDLTRAYDSVDLPILASCLHQLFGSPTSVTAESILELLNKVSRGINGGLATGFPSSPDLFNLYCEAVLDRKFRDICEQYSLRYTRYLDDLLFSSVRPIGKKKRTGIRAIISSAGFLVNDAKARVIDLRRGPCCINGVGLREDGKTFFPRHAARSLQGILHQALYGRYRNVSVINGRMANFRKVTTPPFSSIERSIFALYDRFKRVA